MASERVTSGGCIIEGMGMSKRAVEKTPAETPEAALELQPHGGALLRGNNYGNKGGGRPADEFRRRLASIASSDKALAYLDECIKGKHGPKPAADARQYATEHGYGKLVQPIEISGPGGSPIPHEIIVTRRLSDGET